MEGFGVHIFRLVNAEGRPAFVKFRRKPKLGLQSVVWNEAVKINGAKTEQVAFCTAAVSPYFFPAFSLPRAAETLYLAKGCAGQCRQPGRRFTSPASVSGRWNCRPAMAC
jgi:Catalase